MPIVTRAQTIEINDVTNVTVTTIEQETGEEGLFVRELRIYGTPPAENQQAPLEFTLTLKGVDRQSLQITVPTSEM
jgi:hypothetical protein